MVSVAMLVSFAQFDGSECCSEGRACLPAPLAGWVSPRRPGCGGARQGRPVQGQLTAGAVLEDQVFALSLLPHSRPAAVESSQVSGRGCAYPGEQEMSLGGLVSLAVGGTGLLVVRTGR